MWVPLLSRRSFVWESGRKNRNGKERASQSCFGVAESEEARSCRANLSGDV